MAATQTDLAQQMIAQLRVLDPSISAEVGTPERKIIDTVAQALAESQVDLNVLGGGLDIDSKFGADLDAFLAIFGFGRQQAVKAQGFVTFSRTTPATLDIIIASGTQVNATQAGGTDGTPTIANLAYVTTESVTLIAGSLSVLAPVQCTLAGTIGNVAANTITNFGPSTILGITSITNEAATSQGQDQETDDQLKVRFKNTVFRNLSGTEDQFLALAASTAFTTKANVVGPLSRYREYLQVPDVDDSTVDPDSAIVGNGSGGQWTSALSTIPFSKHIYDTVPYFVSNGKFSIDIQFYRQDTDFVLNTTNAARDKGDTYRGRISSTGPNVNTDTSTTYQPNLTFLNVYTGADTTVQGLRAKDVVLFEHSYMSTASRNDYTNKITNCVDVYLNGENLLPADAVIPRPTAGQNLFTGVLTDRYYSDNYRRVGEPHHRPIQGNIFTALFWQPTIALPSQIVVNTVTYLEGIHYWAVEDVSPLRGTVRARNGIEWTTGINGKAQVDPDGGPYTGPKISANSATSVEVDSYFYDKNIIDLQAAMEGSKQVTTDVLAHRAKKRYFKLDLTVMYTPGSSIADANNAISTAVSTFLDGQYFGTTIQLSDLLQVIHNASGVDNVRWSKEILVAQSLTADSAGNPRDRVVECDVNGNPLLNIVIERVTAGTGSTPEVWQFYITGTPTGGNFKLSFSTFTTAAIAYNASAATITTALSTATIPATITSGLGTPISPFIFTFTGNGARSDVTANASGLTGGTNVFNIDYFLQDDELPTLPTAALSKDTLPGLVIRPRAQNTWSQL